ncbi:uncharacterized protein BO95DRAFT_441263 [Aspergillus brunneoviolaceus CBS 621.78]|uniref:Uncharacterized protein n=1 Tax=Aspergillus brunneoviolaceus CBS 621.78 TaxID=1450534 RepID=A0ACD1GED9_9EURO|nr:hypothetical protein BO95DRAFT_441263 [Aspergillus brunneoviolaceus CBS 621.78]RAH47461.1 hypothetical protein BO95DRAFT_441263 [Aspergillus brunneoviolaceus CBS 621.78]
MFAHLHLPKYPPAIVTNRSSTLENPCYNPKLIVVFLSPIRTKSDEPTRASPTPSPPPKPAPTTQTDPTDTRP